MDSAARTAVDWDQVLRMGNSWYDRMADAYGKPTRAERQAALGKIDDDIRKLAAAAKDWKSLGLSMLGGPRNAISERIGQVFVAPASAGGLGVPPTPRIARRCSSI